MVYNATRSERTSLALLAAMTTIDRDNDLLEHMERVCDESKGADSVPSYELLP
jgi:hypothetical protein